VTLAIIQRSLWQRRRRYRLSIQLLLLTDIMAAAETACGCILDWDNPGMAAAPELVLDYGNTWI
jgi:hypothetical protein